MAHDFDGVFQRKHTLACCGGRYWKEWDVGEYFHQGYEVVKQEFKENGKWDQKNHQRTWERRKLCNFHLQTVGKTVVTFESKLSFTFWEPLFFLATNYDTEKCSKNLFVCHSYNTACSYSIMSLFLFFWPPNCECPKNVFVCRSYKFLFVTAISFCLSQLYNRAYSSSDNMSIFLKYQVPGKWPTSVPLP